MPNTFTTRTGLTGTILRNRPAHHTTSRADEDGEPDDTFLKVLAKLPQRTTNAQVANYVRNKQARDVVLWRGTPGKKAMAMHAKGSAGGVAVNESVGPPTRTATKQQVGGGRQLPEFSAAEADLDRNNSPIGNNWSRGSWLAVVQINTRYLAQGSHPENGWVADPSAPVTVLATVDRTCLKERSGLSRGNASQ